jgi:kinesin family member 6/9
LHEQQIGDAQSYEHRGVAPRAISQLFQEINARIEIEFFVSCTYMEIYNERIYDLLVDVANPEMNGEYTIAEEKDGRGVIVRGLNELEVRDEAAALNLLFTGGLSRTTATHKLNKRSNRSHSIFTLYLQQRQRSGVSEKVRHSKLHLVDLAGSERLKKTMQSAEGHLVGDEVTRKESMAINRSLTYLEQCVVALTRNSGGHVPYRQSKLTNILKDCLGANCNTLLLACMWGEASHLEETVSTLRLASRMMKVTNETVSVESIDPSILLKKQEKMINALKQELLMHDALVERTGVVYDAYTPEQQSEMAQLVERYVHAAEKDEEEVLQIHSFRQMLELCKQFKKKLLEARADVAVAARSGLLATGNGAGLGGLNGSGNDPHAFQETLRAATADLKGTSGGGLGDVKEIGHTVTGAGQRGFALGEARVDNAPANGIETAQGGLSMSFAGTLKANSNTNNNSLFPNEKGNNVSFPDNNSAGGVGGGTAGQSSAMDNFLQGADIGSIEVFLKQSEAGQQLYQQFSQLKTQQKELKGKIRQLTTEVNGAKGEIDRLNKEIDAKKAARAQLAARSRGTSSEAADEEESRLTKALKEVKQSYRNNYEQMQRQHGVLSATGQTMDKLRTRLIDVWRTFAQRNELSSSPSSPQRPSSSGGRFNASQSSVDTSGFGDELDDQEAFDRLEVERVMANDPDSMAFFAAQKTRRANLTQSGGNIRMLQRNKRYI